MKKILHCLFIVWAVVFVLQQQKTGESIFGLLTPDQKSDCSVKQNSQHQSSQYIDMTAEISEDNDSNNDKRGSEKEKKFLSQNYVRSTFTEYSVAPATITSPFSYSSIFIQLRVLRV